MDSKKKLFIALGAAAGSLIFGFAVYKLFSSTQGEAIDPETKEILKDVKTLGTVRVNEYGLIPFEAFLELFRLIRKHSRKRLDVKLEEMTKRRRELLV